MNRGPGEKIASGWLRAINAVAGTSDNLCAMGASVAIVNHLYTELTVGQSVSDTHVFSARDVELMSALSGMPAEGQGWNGVVLAFVVGERFPGPGSVPLALELSVLKPLAIGTTIVTTLTVREKRPPDVVVLDIIANDRDSGEPVFGGVMTVRAPAEKLCLSCDDLPDVRVHEHLRHRQLISRCAGLKPALTAVVHPCDASSLAAAVEAAREGLIIPVLVGPEAKIRAVAAAERLDINAFRLASFRIATLQRRRPWRWRAGEKLKP